MEFTQLKHPQVPEMIEVKIIEPLAFKNELDSYYIALKKFLWDLAYHVHSKIRLKETKYLKLWIKEAEKFELKLKSTQVLSFSKWFELVI